MLVLENLSCGYGPFRAVQSLNLKLEEGSVNALIGANGAGKSTLMKILSGVERQTSGEIYLNGKVYNSDSNYDELFWNHENSSCENHKGYVSTSTKKTFFHQSTAMECKVECDEKELEIEPQLKENDFHPLGLIKSTNLNCGQFNVAIIGAGTGFGAAGLVCLDNTLIPIVGEGGHIGFAPKSQIQTEILNVLKNNYERVIVERLVSGPGIENIYSSLALIYDKKKRELSAKEIFQKAQSKSDQHAIESVDIFFEIFGQLAGDIALCMGARNGVYLAGGIAKRYPELLMKSEFRNAFESKGRQRSYMESIPTILITHDNPGLLGAAYCASKLSSDC
mgnify:CR=1 FL=1